jgi:predicted GIY-YIG superfamily endonuclease
MNENQHETVDIVSLIEDNPITKLNNGYQSKLVNRVRDTFTDTQQRLFVGSFYCYLNYDSKKDFVINLKDVWKWCGFGRVDHAKRLLIKEFIVDRDYKISLPRKGEPYETTHENNNKNEKKEENEKKEKKGKIKGKETIMMTVYTFKKFCMKARTKKADEIHDYYVKMEEMLQDMMKEESVELRNQLQVKDKRCENNILINFSKKPVVYIGLVESNIVKFGYTNNVEKRIKDHKREIHSGFTFEYIYESVYNREIENEIKQHVQLKSRIHSSVIKEKNQTELIQLDNEFSMVELDKLLRIIKDQVENTEKDKDKNIIIESLKLKVQVLQNDNEMLHNENEKLIYNNKRLKEENEDLEKTQRGTKVVDIQPRSMQNLVIKNNEIKHAVCMNFFIHYIVENIKIRDGSTDFIINISVDEFFEKYKKYRISNKYTEPLNNEKYEKSILTKSIKDIPGIKCSSYSTGVRNKIFSVKVIVDWIKENVTIPKHFRNIFRDECGDNYNHKTTCENKELQHIYDFLIYLIIKNVCYQDTTSKGNKIWRRVEPGIKKLNIKCTVVTEEYLKFHLNDYYIKRLTMTKVYNTITKITGIKKCRKENFEIKKKQITVLTVDLTQTLKWLQENIKISEDTKKLLYT